MKTHQSESVNLPSDWTAARLWEQAICLLQRPDSSVSLHVWCVFTVHKLHVVSERTSWTERCVAHWTVCPCRELNGSRGEKEADVQQMLSEQLLLDLSLFFPSHPSGAVNLSSTLLVLLRWSDELSLKQNTICSCQVENYDSRCWNLLPDIPCMK